MRERAIFSFREMKPPTCLFMPTVLSSPLIYSGHPRLLSKTKKNDIYHSIICVFIKVDIEEISI